MKSFIILILLVVLSGGAALSKPSPDDFKTFLKVRAANSQSTLFGKIGADVFADSYIRDCEFKNRVLWETVTKDGKDVYVGAFSHWFGGDELKDVKQDLQQK